jgi:hypothetical protein
VLWSSPVWIPSGARDSREVPMSPLRATTLLRYAEAASCVSESLHWALQSAPSYALNKPALPLDIGLFLKARSSLGGVHTPSGCYFCHQVHAAHPGRMKTEMVERRVEQVRSFGYQQTVVRPSLEPCQRFGPPTCTTNDGSRWRYSKGLLPSQLMP